MMTFAGGFDRSTRLVARVGGKRLVVAGLVVATMSGCASSKASSNGTKTTTATTANTAAQPSGDKPPAAPAEQDALVRVKDKMFPPVDVGSWVCEPKTWNDKGQALLHCTAPAGTDGLIAALKEDPAVAEAEAAK